MTIQLLSSQGLMARVQGSPAADSCQQRDQSRQQPGRCTSSPFHPLPALLLAGILGTQTQAAPHLPGAAGAQLLEAGEGVDGASALPLLPAHSQLLQAPKLLHLGLQLLHLGLQALNGLRQPGGWVGDTQGRDFKGRGQPSSGKLTTIPGPQPGLLGGGAGVTSLGPHAHSTPGPGPALSAPPPIIPHPALTHGSSAAQPYSPAPASGWSAPGPGRSGPAARTPWRAARSRAAVCPAVWSGAGGR